MLIVSPHFPPVNAPDMQRVRLSLPYFAEFGWDVHVLAVAPDAGSQAIDDRLLATLPPEVPITRVNATPLATTAWMGLHNLGWRAWRALYRTGARLLQEQRFDVVYFSTTQFICLPMGRLWRRHFGVPYVIDLQDPWLNDYYFENPGAQRPGGIKYLFAHAAAWLLERWTLRRCSGVISVSESYPRVLRRRYSWMEGVPMTTIPFGVDERDLMCLRQHPVAQSLFSARDGNFHVVSIGRGGDDLLKAVGALFSSVASFTRADASAAARLRIHFAGTNYATADRAQPMFVELARQHGIAGHFDERPWRIPYFEALQCQLDADAILVLGSDDASYSPSKLYSVLMLGKPVLAVVLAGSLLEARLREFPAIRVLAYNASGEITTGASELTGIWPALLELRVGSETGSPSLLQHGSLWHARDLTRAQVEFLDRASLSTVTPPSTHL